VGRDIKKVEEALFQVELARFDDLALISFILFGVAFQFLSLHWHSTAHFLHSAIPP